MIFRLLFLVALLAGPSFWPSAVFGQDKEWERLNIQVLNNYRSGNFVAAARYGEMALRKAEDLAAHDLKALTTSLNNLALSYDKLAEFDKAEALYKRSLAIKERSRFGKDPSYAFTLNNLGLLFLSRDNFEEADESFRRAFGIFERLLRPDHVHRGVALMNLTSSYRRQGRYVAAEQLYRREIANIETQLGGTHPTLATLLPGLASIYLSQGRVREAGPLYERAVAISEAVFEPGHLAVSKSKLGLATFYQKVGRNREAEELLIKSTTALFQKLGPSDQTVLTAINNLAELFRSQGRLEEAEPLYRQLLAGQERSLGRDHATLGTALNNLALLLGEKKNYSQAEPFFLRAIKIAELAGGPINPRVADSLENLAWVQALQGRRRDALSSLRRSTKIRLARINLTGQTEIARVQEQRERQSGFVRHIEITRLIRQQGDAGDGEFDSEAFEVAQLAIASQAGRALANLGARFASGTGELARTIRAQQDARMAWRRMDQILLEAVSRSPDERNLLAEQAMQNQMAELETQLNTVNRRVRTQFPEYLALISRTPENLKSVQMLLGQNEALLSFVVGITHTYVWVVRRDGLDWRRLNINAAQLSDAVQNLRESLEPFGIESPDDIPPFDTNAAYELYQQVFKFAEEKLEGVRHVFVVPDGALQSLPLGVLVTKKPKAPIEDFAGYQDTPWLAKRYALTTLPSVGSLRALRRFAKQTRASNPFIGIGDPTLMGTPGDSRGVHLASLFNARGVADVEKVRNIPSLPDTAAELRALATSLGVGRETLLLRDQATETAIKKTDFSNTKVVAFATHGLVAGDLHGLAEPALVLTPPQQGTTTDDGLLTASEAAQLKLDADLVILSACNTAAADGTPGAEALSGLTKAFLYAGSRALLVSHWPVVSGAAVRLTTKMFEFRARRPDMGRATALQQSMLALMADKKNTFFAHPMFWAPFVIVGEGG